MSLQIIVYDTPSSKMCPFGIKSIRRVLSNKYELIFTRSFDEIQRKGYTRSFDEMQGEGYTRSFDEMQGERYNRRRKL